MIESKPFTLVLLGFLGALVISLSISLARDGGYGGPHHDEVIALMAAKGLERDYFQASERGNPPFHEAVEATEWHRYTRDLTPVRFSEIRQDLMNWDRHPPLAFWVLNHWLSLFDEGGYTQALMLIWFQVLLAAGILAITILRVSGTASAAAFGFALFLVGNSAVFTGTWVRQYGLFLLIFAGVVALSSELVRRGIVKRQFVMLCVLMALLCLFGMMTQYTFIAMTAPIHFVLLLVLASRRDWVGVGILATAYVAAGILFFNFLPGVMDHVTAVSAGLERKWQWYSALGGVPQMYIPMPSSFPGWLVSSLGAIALLLPFVLAWYLLRANRGSETVPDRSVIAVPLAGMLGTGLLQFLLVGFGFFPGWATGPNHLAAFWMLTVFAASLFLMKIQFRGKQVVVVLIFLGMLGMQGLYAWHLHRISPHLNKSYIASRQPDLVLIDNLARGFVLEITDIMPADRLVLATESSRMARKFEDGSLRRFATMLYLPMDTTVLNGKARVMEAAQTAGWHVTKLPVVHEGMYEAIWFEQD